MLRAAQLRPSQGRDAVPSRESGLSDTASNARSLPQGTRDKSASDRLQRTSSHTRWTSRSHRVRARDASSLVGTADHQRVHLERCERRGRNSIAWRTGRLGCPSTSAPMRRQGLGQELERTLPRPDERTHHCRGRRSIRCLRLGCESGVGVARLHSGTRDLE